MKIKQCLNRVLTSLLLLSSLTTALAQDSLSHELWEELREEIQYNPPEDREKKRFERTEMPDFQTSDAFTWLLYAVFFLVVIGIIIMVWQRGRAHKKRKPGDRLTAQLEEEALDQIDLEGLLREAKQQEDYRLAVRVYYLIVLRDLDKQKLIRWRRDATNHEYLRQMQGHSLYPDFRTCTQLFELIWYGDHVEQAPAFPETEAHFKQLLEALQGVTSSQNPAKDGL